MEHLLEDVSFRASELSGQKIEINSLFVDVHLSDVLENEDLSRYIL
jgi:ATP-dependent HslUV protease ATP-binding subunit HslU